MKFEEALPLLRQGKIMHYDGFYRYRIRSGVLECQSKNDPNDGWKTSKNMNVIMTEHWKVEEAPRQHMNVLLASELLKMGKKMAREVFVPGDFVQADQYGVLRSRNGNAFVMHIHDCVSSDWYEVTT